MICYEDIDLACQECYRVARPNCNPFTLPVGLTPSASVFLILTDKNGVQFSQQVTINLDGSLPIIPNDFGQILSKYGGEYVMIVSETENPSPVSLSISARNYECLLLSFDDNCGCEEQENLFINGDLSAGSFGWQRNAPGGDPNRVNISTGLITVTDEGMGFPYEFNNTYQLPVGNYQCDFNFSNQIVAGAFAFSVFACVDRLNSAAGNQVYFEALDFSSANGVRNFSFSNSIPNAFLVFGMAGFGIDGDAMLFNQFSLE